jgi:hypothetical protein
MWTNEKRGDKSQIFERSHWKYVKPLKGHSHNSVEFFYSLQFIINVFLIIRQNACVIWHVRREIQPSNALLCKLGSTHLLNLPFKSIFGLLAHLSWKLKWAILITGCPSVCLSVNFYIFDFSRTTWPILTRLGTNHSWLEGIQVCSNEEKHPSPRGDDIERVQIH